MPSIPLPGETFTFSVPLVSQASSHVFQAAPTIAAGDFKRSINNGSFANMDNLPTVTPAAGKLVQIVVSAAETTAAGEGGTIDIVGSDAAGAEWDDISVCLRVGVIAANAAQLSGDSAAADNAEAFFDGTGYVSAGTINSVSSTVTAQLADGVVHGGNTAEIRLKKVEVVNPDMYGTALLLNAAAEGGKGLNVQAQDAQNTGLYSRWPGAQMQDIADSLAIAPTPGTSIATGSAYNLLTTAINEQSQLDWQAWATSDGALADLYDDNAVDALTGSGTTLAAEGSTGFAAWVLQEFDDKLFVGVGKTPMNYIAAVIGSIATAGAAPTFEYALPEEGVSAMTVGSDGKLYVAGVDERTNTGTSSIYIRTAAGVWTRKQTVTGWQHICGIREDGLLWIAGQGAASVLMYSSDGGDTWVDTDLTLGRAYDVIKLGTYLIATHWDGDVTYTVHRSAAVPAFSWSPVAGIEGGYGRMVEWEGVVVGVTVSGALFTVNSSGTGTEYTLPFTPRQTYNNLVVDTGGYLCVLGTTGVWRTNDLTNWKQVWSFSPADTVRSLGTWGDNLVVSTDGATAQVLARPASPEAAQQQMIADATLDTVIEGTHTMRQLLRLFSSMLLSKASGGGTDTLVFRDIDNSKNRVTITVDAHGNRSSVTLDED